VIERHLTPTVAPAPARGSGAPGGTSGTSMRPRPGRRRQGLGLWGVWVLLLLGLNAPRMTGAACAKWCSARGKCVMDTCYCLDGFSGSDCSRHEYMVRPTLTSPVP